MTEDNSDLFDPALTLDVQPQVEATYTAVSYTHLTLPTTP